MKHKKKKNSHADAENALTMTLSMRELIDQKKHLKLFSIETVFRIVQKYWVRLLAVTLAAAIVLGACFYWANISRVNALMTLNYEESAQGLTPNGTRLDLNELLSDEVLDAAITQLGLTDEMTADDLAKMISISPRTNGTLPTDEDLESGVFHVSSSYQIDLHMPNKYMKAVSADALLQAVCDCYKTSFYDHNLHHAKILQTEKPDFTAMDYEKAGQYMNVLLAHMIGYLKNRSSIPSQSDADAVELNSLRENATALLDYDLSTYSSYIWEQGVSRDPVQRAKVLSFFNDALSRSYRQSLENAEMYQGVVAEYNPAIIASAFIPTYNTEREYYMSRTRTGVDDLSEAADRELSDAFATRQRIVFNQDRIRKLDAKNGSAARVHADVLIENLWEKYSEIVDQILRMDKKYTSDDSGSFMSIRISPATLVSALHLKKTAAGALLVCAVCYVVLFLTEKRSLTRQINAVKKMKREAKNG